MKRHFGSLLAGFILFSAVGAAAQQPQPATPTPPPVAAPSTFGGTTQVGRQVAPAPPVPVPGRQVVAAAAPAARAAVDDSAGGQPVNIRVEVTIVDQTSTGQPVRRVINILAADRSFARIRSLFTDPPEATAMPRAGLSPDEQLVAIATRNPDNRRVDVDARPRIVGNSIRVELVIQNNALGSGNPLLNWTQSFTVFLENGKSATPIESTDPSTSRKMSIEVKATILK